MKELRKPSPYPLHDTVSGVVDCFLVNDQIELAKFRIGYLKQEVSYFVIGESSLTHSGKSKDLYFAKSREAGNFLEDNILLFNINLDDYKDAWQREIASREKLLEFAVSYFPNAQFILSDVDEIPSLSQVRKLHQRKENLAFVTPVSYRYVNWRLADDGHNNYCSGVFGDSTLAQAPNGSRGSLLPILESDEVGIHASYLQINKHSIIVKMKSFAHEEFSYAEIANGKTISFANTFAVDHVGRFDHKGFGLLKILSKEEMGTVEQEMLKSNPNWFKFSVEKKRYLARMWASIVITVIVRSDKYRERVYRYFIENQELKMPQWFYLKVVCLLLAMWYLCSRRMPFLEVSFYKSVGLISKCKYWLNGLLSARKCKNRQ